MQNAAIRYGTVRDVIYEVQFISGESGKMTDGRAKLTGMAHMGRSVRMAQGEPQNLEFF